MRESATSLNVIIATVANDNETNAAIEAIEKLDADGHIKLGDIGFIERTTMGWVMPRSLQEDGCIEGLADALNVPKGVDQESAAATLSFIGRQVPEGSQAIVMLAAEREDEMVLDRALSKRGGEIHRRPAIDVFTEVEELMQLQKRWDEYHRRAQKKLETVGKN